MRSNWGALFIFCGYVQRKNEQMLKISQKFEVMAMKKATLIPIERTADTMTHLGSNYYYIRHIFNALREHKEILQNSDYKRLYDEAIDYLFRHAVEHCGWSKSERNRAYEYIELLSDLSNSHNDTEKYSIENVDAFLTERRTVWS